MPRLNKTTQIFVPDCYTGLFGRIRRVINLDLACVIDTAFVLDRKNMEIRVCLSDKN